VRQAAFDKLPQRLRDREIDARSILAAAMVRGRGQR
jgi:hypothetical protein